MDQDFDKPGVTYFVTQNFSELAIDQFGVSP
jgi:hypothetical protein